MKIVNPIPKSGKLRKGTTLLRTADELCGRIVRARGVCQNPGCGKTTDLQWAHGFSRSYRVIRHDLRNGFCLCRACHMRYTHRPIEWDEWLHLQWGSVLYAELRDLALRGPRVDLKETVAYLRDLERNL